MKKLIAMIGAVAMSFGLFAANYAISFEQAEDSQNMGVNTTSMQFTPPTEAGWTWEAEPFALSAYLTGEEFAYGSGAEARRSGFFFDKGLSDNANYLPLSTGSDELTLAVGEGNIYLDQLVKFTGFEDPQTNLVAGTKIAVWMSEFENDDESTETNLYVTVGKVDANNVAEQVALKIDGTYSLDTWYRLSIKSLGDIYKGAEFTTPRAAFLVYVNGKQVTVAEEDMKVATALITNEGSMDGIARDYMAKGQLFTSIAADATFTSVGYQGIGAVDDIIIDNQGPAFCQTINVVIPEVYGAVVDYVDVGGTRMQPPVSVPDGTTITVYFKPAPGKKITGGVTSVTQTISTGAATIIVSGIIAEDVVATLTLLDGTASDLAASELATALANLGVGAKIAISAACEITEGEGEAQTTLYAFTPNTTITGTQNGATIYVGNYLFETEPMPGELTVNDAVPADAVLSISFEDGMLYFGGTVAGALEVVNGTTTLASGIELAAGASIKAAVFDFESYGATITLTAVGATVKAPDNSLIDSGSIVAGADLSPQVSPEPDKDGYYTYTAVQAGVEKVELAFTSLPADTAVTAVTGNTVEGDAETGWKAVAGDTLTITLTAQNGKVFNENGDTTTTVQAEASASIDLSAAPAPFAAVAKVNNVYYETAEAALAKVQELKVAEQFPIVAKALADEGLTIMNPETKSTITIAKNDTITIRANSLTFSGLPTITGQIALAADATFTVLGQIANYTTVFSAPADYEVVEIANGDGTYTYSASAIPSYTVAAISVANAKVEATNKTAKVALELPATVLRDTEIAVTVTPNENYEYKNAPAGWTKNEDGSITTNATVTADLAITVEAPTAALQPVDPETPKNYDSKEAADAAAAAINANKTAMIKTPDGADAADYTALFTAVVKANNEVVVELNEGGTNALKAAATTIETAVAGKLDDIAAATAGNSVSVKVTVGVKNGFWYGVAATTDLTTLGTTQPTEWVQAKNGSVTINATKPATGNAAFFQTRVKVK